MVLGLDRALMSLLQVVIQSWILAEAGDKPLGKRKVVAAVQLVMSTLEEDQLPLRLQQPYLVAYQTTENLHQGWI